MQFVNVGSGSLLAPGSSRGLHSTRAARGAVVLKAVPPQVLQSNWGTRKRPCSLRVYSAKRDGASKEERRSKARTTRAIPIRVVSVAKAGGGPGQVLAKSYIEKIRRYCVCEELVIRPNPKNTQDADIQVTSEGERVLKVIGPQDHVVVLDERGRDLTSEQLADLVADAGESGCSSIAFCIGGPYGHSEAVRDRGNAVIRLSSMVLNHEVALIVLLEQIYRAWTILKGEKYHH